MAVREGIYPTRIDEAGWGILFPSNGNSKIAEALAPLLSRRREQATAGRANRYREFRGDAGGVHPGESKNAWLARLGAGPGLANPDVVPYYLLIAASPAEISFQFEAQLNVQYAVGRVWFKTLAGWRAYAGLVLYGRLKDRRK